MDDFNNKVKKATRTHNRVEQCKNQASAEEQKFLKLVNSMPELSKEVLGWKADTDRSGNFRRFPDGELYGTYVFGLDPGLRNIAKRHYDYVRLKCSADRR
jgi:oligoribonuclease (3'-5' exoribonuclease)